MQLNHYLHPRQTKESRAVLHWRHQEDKFCYSNVSRCGIYGQKPSEGGSLCTDRLHNGRSFCYLFLRFNLKPLFMAAPVPVPAWFLICQVGGFPQSRKIQRPLPLTRQAQGQVHRGARLQTRLTDVNGGSCSLGRPAQPYFNKQSRQSPTIDSKSPELKSG